MKNFFYWIFLVLPFLFAGCHKDKKLTPATTVQQVADSIYYYAREDYLWYDALPDYNTFNPRQYATADNYTALQKEVNAISQLKTNPTTGNAYEYNSSNPGTAKYSFIDEGQTAAALSGSKGDFGFQLAYGTSSTDLRVRYVYPNSPAAQAGIHRADLVTRINNLTSIDGSDNTAYNNVVAALSNNTVTLYMQRPDGSTYTANLTAANYTVNPVLLQTVFDEGNGEKVGYLVFNSFTELTNAKSVLDQAFSYFTTNNITDLVVDLRYNGGGAIETAEYMDDYIIPSSYNSTLMYGYYYNSILQSGKEVLLKNQWRYDPTSNQDYNYGQLDYSVAGNQIKFAKNGTLNLNRIFFIVTNSTASASELTINNLIPHMNVQLIGQTTYGKPVGFFALDIGKYQLYIPEFQTKNSAGAGDYYSGMQPGTATYPGIDDSDDLTKDFGDPTERLLAHALNYVKTGTFSIPQQQVENLGGTNLAVRQQIDGLNRGLDSKNFKGMVLTTQSKRK